MMPEFDPRHAACIRRRLRRNYIVAYIILVPCAAAFIAGKAWVRHTALLRDKYPALAVTVLSALAAVVLAVFFICDYLRRTRLASVGEKVDAEVVAVGEPQRGGDCEITLAYEYEGERYQMVHMDQPDHFTLGDRVELLVDPARPFNFVVVQELFDE